MSWADRGVGLPRGVSVIVCCYNSSGVIEPTITALARQRGLDRPLELIVVDNNCTDDTLERVSRTWDERVGPLRVLRETTPGLIHARKVGVRAAEYEHLVWVDDDNILAEDWIHRACAVLDEHPRVAAVGGVNEPRVDGGIPDWFERFAGVYACGTQGDDSGPVTRTRKMLFGAGLACRTRLMLRVLEEGPPLYLVGRTGNKLLRGDDSEICMRLALEGWELWYDRNLRLEHHLLPHRLRWDYVCRARMGGAAAFHVLYMYQQLIDARPPVSWAAQVKDLLRRLKRHLSHRLRGRYHPGPGSEEEIEWWVLKGRAWGLWALGTRYGRIRRELMHSFGEHRPERQEAS